MAAARGGSVDVVVIGAGLMGAATAWSASRAGLSVQVLEQFEPGHRRGSSHGSARIVRRAYASPLYTRLSGRTFELWRELEADSGAQLLRILGGVDFGTERDLRAVVAGLAEVGAEHEVLSAAEAEREWPGMRFDGEVVYHPEAGALDPDSAITAMLDGARRRGALVQHGARVLAVRAGDDGGHVELAGGQTVNGRVVAVAAGAWADGLLADLVTLPPLRVTQQQFFHFPRLDATAQPWPSVIHQADGHGWYSLAGGRDGGPGDDRKVAEHDFGKHTSGDDRDGVVDPESRARVVEYVQRWLPGLDPRPSSEGTCLYTTTPSEDFILDRAGSLVVCSPCSGHGAKFAPLIGELCTGLVTGTADVPERFRLAEHARGIRRSVSL